MKLPRRSHEDVLAEPTRARLFELLCELGRPVTSSELAEATGRHANTVRVQLRRLAGAGLVERTFDRQGRGRPSHLWALTPAGSSAVRAQEADGNLGRWLARAFGTSGRSVEAVERTGAAIGRELGPAAGDREVSAVMADALTGMGFEPRAEPLEGAAVRFVLGNCPFRDAVRENQPVVCALHRGITRGLLQQLDPRAALAAFVPRDPDAAGCLIDIALPQT